MQIMAFVVLWACLAIQCVHGATSPQELQFSVYVHDKETKIVTGSIDAVHANAYGTYNFNSSVAGWNTLDISANKNPASSESHLENMYAMGFAEGYVSCQEIHTFWQNFYQDLFGNLLTPPGGYPLLRLCICVSLHICISVFLRFCVSASLYLCISASLHLCISVFLRL